MILFFVFFLLCIYALLGLLVSVICMAIIDCHDNFFGDAIDNMPEANFFIITITFWPIFSIYLIGWCIVWYIKHLYISVRDLFKSFIKIKK